MKSSEKGEEAYGYPPKTSMMVDYQDEKVVTSEVLNTRLQNKVHKKECEWWARLSP